MIKQFTKLLLGLVLLLISGTTKAQTDIASYQFTKTTGASYTPVTGGTTLFTSTYDNSVSAVVPLGGTFIFGGVAFTQCYISSNGFITFGAAPGTATYTPLSTLGTTTGAISAFGQDAGASTVTGAAPEISYLNVGGSAGEFVVQYKDHANYFNRAQERLNFQIRLNLSTNEINIVYGDCTNPGTVSTSGTATQVGIRGNSVTWATNVNNLLIGNIPAATTCNWSDAVTGNANNSALLFSGTTNVNVNIPNGLTYTWIPATSPAPVRTFYAVSNITTTDATITWAPATGATQYNVQYRVPGSCSWTDFTGNPVSDTMATLSGLSVGTSYQIRVQSVSGSGNSIWSHIPAGTAGTGTNGYTVTGTFTTVVTCPAPTSVAVSSITTSSATTSFTSSGNSFTVEYGAVGFTPGTGATAGSGGTIVAGTASPIALTGLSASTTYDVYVRQNCTSAGNGYSQNSVKLTFTTPCSAVTTFTENFDAITAPALPACFRKVGAGGTANTQTGTPSSSPNTLYLFSSVTTSQALVALAPVSNAGAGTHQLRFKLRANFTAGDTLQVGYLTNISDSSTFVVLTQIRAASLTYTEYSVLPGTAPGANQYLAFRAKGTAGASMLIDDISWEPIPACPIPSGITINTITATSASVSFTSTGNSFIVEYGATGFTPGTGTTAGAGGTVITGTASPIIITGLTATTTYQVYIRQNCTAAGNGFSANSTVVAFTTTVACPAPTTVTVSSITANSASVSFTSSGSGFVLEYGATGFTPGTGATAGAGGTVITGTASPIVIAGLTPTTTYQVYIRQNCTTAGNGFSTNSTLVSFTTNALPPSNDACANAVELTVSNRFCSSPVLGTLAGADSTNGLGTAPCQTTALKFDVWYKVTVPASGNVTVQTSAVNTTVSDLVMQAYSGTCGALTAIGCDDDGNPDASPSGLHPRLGLTGRAAGEVIYYRVLPYSSLTNAGSFAICAFDTSATALPAIALGAANTCNPAVTITADSVWKYTWVPIKDASGAIIAEVYPNGNNLGAITASYYRNTGAVRTAGPFYLDRNFTITPANQPGTSRPGVRLYFTDAELAAFATAAGATTRSQLMVTKNNAPCSGTFLQNGNVGLGTLNGNGTYGTNHFIEDTLSSFSSFFIHRTGTILPISLTYLKGIKAGTGNALNWKVNCTSVSITMELERSSDSRSFKSITSITATQARCGQPFDYTDASPLKGTNYYRLKMIDVDGKVSYSPIVAIIGSSSGAELVGIYPTVVQGEAFLSVAASRNTKMQLNITDMSGRVIKTISQTVANGSSLININTASLSSGVYNITGMLDGVQTKTLRFVKQ